jgi:S1-C subfamily serine protease
VIKELFVALSILIPFPNIAPDIRPDIPATVDLSAVRYIACDSKEGPYTGSAFLIDHHVLATARHVAIGDHCIDVASNTPVLLYKQDDRHDFALMVAPGVDDNIPFVKYRCDGIQPNKPYLSYGITDYGQNEAILRMNTVYSTRNVVGNDDAVDGLPHSKGMVRFAGPIAPGMSGGPVVDLSGYAVAVNNAGDGHNSMLFDLKDTILCK